MDVFFLFSFIVTATFSLQGPSLGQRAGQNNQAKEGQLPPEWGSPRAGNQGGAGPHHRLLSVQTRNWSDILFSFFLTSSYFVQKILSPVYTINVTTNMFGSLQMI